MTSALTFIGITCIFAAEYTVNDEGERPTADETQKAFKAYKESKDAARRKAYMLAASSLLAMAHAPTAASSFDGPVRSAVCGSSPRAYGRVGWYSGGAKLGTF